jgi:hypothetical protein
VSVTFRMELSVDCGHVSPDGVRCPDELILDQADVPDEVCSLGGLIACARQAGWALEHGSSRCPVHAHEIAPTIRAVAERTP